MSELSIPPPRSRSGCMTAFIIMMSILVGSIVLLGGGIAYLFFGLARSEGAAIALKRASETPAVMAKLGSPVTRGTFATGSYSVNTNGTGTIDMALPVSGPTGSGQLLIVGTRTNHLWSYTRLVVVPAGETAEIPVK